MVTGTPGVGKTSVSTLLASKLVARRIDLAQIVKKEELTKGLDEKRNTLIADISRLSKRVNEIIRNCEQNIVVDGHYSVDVVPSRSVFLVFVLRRDPLELKNVLEERGFTGAKLWENLEAEILDVCLWDAIKADGVEKVCEIDCTGKTVEQSVEEVVSIIEGNEKCRTGIVDWLGKLESEGLVDYFLKNL